jgi:hypothetical protein
VKIIRVFKEGSSGVDLDTRDYVSTDLNSWEDVARVLNNCGWEFQKNSRWLLPGVDDSPTLVAEIVDENGGSLPVSKLPSKRRE